MSFFVVLPIPTVVYQLLTIELLPLAGRKGSEARWGNPSQNNDGDQSQPVESDSTPSQPIADDNNQSQNIANDSKTSQNIANDSKTSQSIANDSNEWQKWFESRFPLIENQALTDVSAFFVPEIFCFPLS